MLVCALLFAGASIGCQSSNRAEKYIPAEDLAESAVRAALVDWREGKPAGQIERMKPSVQVVDTHRPAGQELVEFEILGPVAGPAPRCFAAKVVLRNPDAEERVRFVVVGIDPLWVFRQEDYEMFTRWDMVMPEPEPANPDGGSAASASQEPTRE